MEKRKTKNAMREQIGPGDKYLVGTRSKGKKERK